MIRSFWRQVKWENEHGIRVNIKEEVRQRIRNYCLSKENGQLIWELKRTREEIRLLIQANQALTDTIAFYESRDKKEYEDNYKKSAD